MDIDIREIEENDYPEVTVIFKNELWDKFNHEQIVLFFNKINNDDHYKTFVALSDNCVVGFVSTVTMLWPGPSEVATTLFIQGIAVKNEYQNKGIGKKLLNHIEDYAITKGISGIGLQSGEKRTAAHIFYEHNGYTRSNYFYKNFK